MKKQKKAFPEDAKGVGKQVERTPEADSSSGKKKKKHEATRNQAKEQDSSRPIMGKEELITDALQHSRNGASTQNQAGMKSNEHAW